MCIKLLGLENLRKVKVMAEANPWWYGAKEATKREKEMYMIKTMRSLKAVNVRGMEIEVAFADWFGHELSDGEKEKFLREAMGQVEERGDQEAATTETSSEEV